jgi:hypothetical protein
MACAGGGCHSSPKAGVQCDTASNCFQTLTSSGYLDGSTNPPLLGNQSCLSWFGGDMPPGGQTAGQAVTDFQAWAAAGAQNN